VSKECELAASLSAVLRGLLCLRKSLFLPGWWQWLPSRFLACVPL